MLESIKNLLEFVAMVSMAISAIALILKLTPFAGRMDWFLRAGLVLLGASVFLWLVLTGLSAI